MGRHQARCQPMSSSVESLRTWFSASTSPTSLKGLQGKVVVGERADAVQNVVVRRRRGGTYQ